jgi:hypothetical protein
MVAIKPSWRKILTAFALLALCVRVLIPGGYMLGGQAADGHQVLVTLCSAQGPMQIALDLDSGAAKNPDTQHSGKSSAAAPCVFAAVSALEAPFLDVAPLEVAIVSEAFTPEAFEPRPGLGLAAPPPPAIGPPLNA